MSDFLQDIEKCLNNRYKMSAGTKVFQEPQNNTSITIVSRGKFLMYSFDLPLGVDLFPFFSSTTPKLRRVCDYIIFCKRQSDDKPFVLIVELKTKMNPVPQLWATKQFVDFLMLRVNAACNSKHLPEIKKIGIIESMPHNLQKAFRSGATRAGKVLYNSDNITYLKGKKFILADYLIP